MISYAIIEFEGTIYQYVGDEVVCSWKFERITSRKCLNTVIQARKEHPKATAIFQKKIWNST